MTIKADEKQTSRKGYVMRDDLANLVQYGDLSSLKIRLDVDAADAIKALKAIQREARAAARALRELEAEIERKQPIEVEIDGRKVGEIVMPSAQNDVDYQLAADEVRRWIEKEYIVPVLKILHELEDRVEKKIEKSATEGE